MFSTTTSAVREVIEILLYKLEKIEKKKTIKFLIVTFIPISMLVLIYFMLINKFTSPLL